MSSLKKIFMLSVVLFGTIGIAGAYKKKMQKRAELALYEEVAIERSPVLSSEEIQSGSGVVNYRNKNLPRSSTGLPSGDKVSFLFSKGVAKFPFMKTLKYKSHTSWKKGRPAWISDYANHYKTSRHFIARSLHGKPEYYRQNVSNGDSFNVFDLDRPVTFELIVDFTRSKMWMYVLDEKEDTRYLVKTYSVGLGRFDEVSPSGSLTPLGTYSIGRKTTTFTPGVYGNYRGEQTEMVTVFGTRWIPFEEEIEGCTEPASGYGIHGVPWLKNESDGKYQQNSASIGKYESDGCIRMLQEDVEEIFAITSFQKTKIQIVADFSDAKLPGSQEL